MFYSKEIPPPKSKEGDASDKTLGLCKILQALSYLSFVTVMVSTTLLNILDIKELEGIWHPKFILGMKWYDSRLQMQNLKEDTQLNVLTSEDRKDPWMPKVIFNNHKDRKRVVLDESTSLVARKEGNGTYNGPRSLEAAEVYSGAENPLVYERSYSLDLECDFDLHHYPFDSQECFIELGVPFALRNKVGVKAGQINFTQKVDLSQFKVQSSIALTDDGIAYFVVIFKRKFAYHLVSVYIPSLSLLIVSLATLHISVDHFEANIMVHLTAMLVMYTLFQAISVSLPKVLNLINHQPLPNILQTAYIKFMDGWLLFGLTLPFISFVLSILEELCQDKEEDMTKVS